MTLKSALKQFLPQSVREYAKLVLRKYRYFRNRVYALNKNNVLTKKNIIESLNELGINPGDTIILHSSLSRLGLVEGGAEAVIRAIQDLVGEDGTVMVPTIQIGTSAVEHFSTDPVFDVKSTPNAMGIISETLRLLPKAVRSIHPTHSVAAVGKNASYLVSDHQKGETPFGVYSPYYRLGELNGKIIMLGVPLAHMTNFHVVEDMLADHFPYPVYLNDPVDARMIGYDGVEFKMKTKIHNPEMSQRRRCNEMEKHFVGKGFFKTGYVGKGRTIVMDASKLKDVLLDLAKKNITMYTPDGVVIESLKL